MCCGNGGEGGLITVSLTSVSFQQVESDAEKQIFSGAGLLTRVWLKPDLFLQKTLIFFTHASTREALKGRFKMVWGGGAASQLSVKPQHYQVAPPWTTGHIRADYRVPIDSAATYRT